MALYQSIHTGKYIDEQISAVNQKLPLTGGIVEGDITANKFIGSLEGVATQASKLVNSLVLTSNGTPLKTWDGSAPETIDFVAGDNIIFNVAGQTLTISSEAEPYSLPNAGNALGGVKTGGVATISNGQITAISKAAEADSATNAASAVNAANATNIYSSASTAKAFVLGTTTASSANHATVYNASVYTSGSVLYGAAWNDYAEYRKANSDIKPGYCVTSNNKGEVSVTAEKMQYCEGIVSDTFGFAIGETDVCKIPLAVSGRVLAYYNGNKDDYNAGDPICAGPNGKVCKMTREEVSLYPDRLIGTVSEIPDYDVWGEDNIQVEDRIWIKIK